MFLLLMTNSSHFQFFEGAKLDRLVPFKTRRVLSLLLGSLEMCFAGVAFGMNALFPVFQENGIYGEVCNNSSSGCTEQLIIYANAYTTVSVVPSFLGAALSLLIDKIGLRVVNLISTILDFAGLILFLFLYPSSAVIIFIGGTLSTIGGTGMIACTLSASKLFTRSASIVTTLIQGVFDTSPAMFAFVYLTNETHFSFKTSILILAVICLISGISNSLFVMSYWMEDMMQYRGKCDKILTVKSEVNSYEVNDNVLVSILWTN